MSLNKEISNWMQHGKRTLERERTPLQQIDANTFSPKKNCQMPGTSFTSNFDDTSCASFSSSESYTNDFIDEPLSARSSPVTNNSLLLSPTSTKSTNSFKKPLYI